MSCLIHFLAACLFDPSNVYVTAEMEADIFAPHTDMLGGIGHGEGEWCRKDWCTGPVGVLKLGVVTPLTSSFTLDYGFSHRSRINTLHDRGRESVYLSLTWRPFR